MTRQVRAEDVVLRTVLIVGVSLTLLAAAPVSAQSAPSGSGSSRPFRGLFGPREIDEQRSQTFDLTLSMFGAVDDNSRFVSDNDALDATLQAQRLYEGARAGLAFKRRRPRYRLTAGGASALRYYPDLHRATTAKHSGSIGVEFVPSRRWKVQLAQIASYSPYYQLELGRSPSGLSGPDRPVANPDYSVSRDKQMVYDSFAGTAFAAGRRGEVALSVGRRYTDFFAGPDFNFQTAGAKFTYRLSRDLGLRLGYGRGVAVQQGSKPIENQNVDLGVDYKRSFAFSPRTSFGLSSGSTVVSAQDGRHVQLTGVARLYHQLSKRWTSQIAFERGLEIVENAAIPFMTGTFIGSLSGYVTPRISIRWLPTYSRGVALTDTTKAYYSFSSQTQLNVAINRHWTVYLEDFYYHYTFPPIANLPAALAAGLDRHGVRAGLTLWTPVLR